MLPQGGKQVKPKWQLEPMLMDEKRQPSQLPQLKPQGGLVRPHPPTNMTNTVPITKRATILQQEHLQGRQEEERLKGVATRTPPLR